MNTPRLTKHHCSHETDAASGLRNCLLTGKARLVAVLMSALDTSQLLLLVFLQCWEYKAGLAHDRQALTTDLTCTQPSLLLWGRGQGLTM